MAELDTAKAIVNLHQHFHGRAPHLIHKCPSCQGLVGGIADALAQAVRGERRLHAGAPPFGIGSLLHARCRTCAEILRSNKGSGHD